MRIVVLAEGSTERGALEPFLRTALGSRGRRGIGVSAIDGGGASKLRTDLLQNVRIYLDQSRSDEIAGVIALFDLLSPPEVFASSGPNDEDRMDATASQIERAVGDDRFRVMFACPEIEAWLFADADIFPSKVREGLPERLTRAPEKMPGKPSDELNALYRRATGKAYRKTTDGRNLFAKLNPERVADRCPRFRMLLDAIVELADRAST